MHGGFESAVGDSCGGEEFDAVAEISSDDEVEEFDVADALEDDVFDLDLGSEGEADEDGEFLSGVESIDIHCRVGFCVAAVLCFEENSFVGLLFIEHAAEDEIAGAIEDGFDGEDPIPGESSIDGGDNGNAAGDGGFEGDGALGLFGGIEEFVAVFVEECFVGRDDIFSGVKEAEDLGASGFDAADHVHDGVDFGVSQEGLEFGGDGDAGEIDGAMQFGSADDDVFELDGFSGLCSDEIRGGLEDAYDTGADSTAADESDIEGWRVWHLWGALESGWKEETEQVFRESARIPVWRAVGGWKSGVGAGVVV